jgi:hypothetical protein
MEYKTMRICQYRNKATSMTLTSINVAVSSLRTFLGGAVSGQIKLQSLRSDFVGTNLGDMILCLICRGSQGYAKYLSSRHCSF